MHDAPSIAYLHPISIYDAVEVAAMPERARYVVAYVDGVYANREKLKQRFPDAEQITMSVIGEKPAQAYDVENGALTMDDVASFIRVDHAAGYHRPVVYVSVGLMPLLVERLSRSGILRSTYRVWTAHWTGESHICGAQCGLAGLEPPGATQWHGPSLLNEFDTSVTTLGWWNAVKHDWNASKLS